MSCPDYLEIKNIIVTFSTCASREKTPLAQNVPHKQPKDAPLPDLDLAAIEMDFQDGVNVPKSKRYQLSLSVVKNRDIPLDYYRGRLESGENIVYDVEIEYNERIITYSNGILNRLTTRGYALDLEFTFDNVMITEL